MAKEKPANRIPPDTGDPFTDMQKIVEMLRSPGGCPWDIRQTLESAVEDLMSEADEVREAIEKGDMDNLREELGDLLWAIVFTANIAREKHLFDVDDILRATREKMIRRHPHIFGGVDARTPEEAMEAYQEVKRKEKGWE